MNHVCHVIVTHTKIIAIEEKQTCPKTSTYATIQTHPKNNQYKLQNI